MDIPTVQPDLLLSFCTQDSNAIKQETQPKLDKATKKALLSFPSKQIRVFTKNLSQTFQRRGGKRKKKKKKAFLVQVEATTTKKGLSIHSVSQTCARPSTLPYTGSAHAHASNAHKLPGLPSSFFAGCLLGEQKTQTKQA